MLITRGLCTQLALKTEEQHIFDWVSDHTDALIERHPAIATRPIWVIAHTISARGISNKAWEDGSKNHIVGVKAGAKGYFDVELPSYDHFVMKERNSPGDSDGFAHYEAKVKELGLDMTS
jgi:hypothetical protein